MKIFKKAFTLVEVLVVMGIIGVVGILAVSNARRDTDEAEKVSQLRKCYEIIDTAYATAVAENGYIETWGNNTSTAWTVISQYFKLSKQCDTSSGCWKDAKQLKINNTESSLNINTSDDYRKGILVNGASIAIKKNVVYGPLEMANAAYLPGLKPNSNFATVNTGKEFYFDKPEAEFLDNESIHYVYVDVNGPYKGLNKLGDDIFRFNIYNDGTVKPSSVGNYGTGLCTSDGEKCTAWVIQFGNEDYLKLGSDGKCPDGKTLSWDGNHSCRGKK